jgi:type I restriction enzyme, S subunit
MELKPGYKLTDVGVIPDEWMVKRLGDLAKVHDGTHQTPKYVTDGIPFYSVEHITSGDFTNTKFISNEEHRFLTRSYKLERGDVLMTRIGSIGECRLVNWDVNASFYVSLALLKIHGADAAFFTQYSNSRAFKTEAELHSLLSAIPKKINLGPISDIRLALPPLPEQRAIAEALSDVDALLDGLDRLIAKKRDIKQATMQQLLTGKTRLPGFSGEWEVKMLGDLLTICHGKSQKGVESTDGPYPILASGGQIGKANHYIYDKPSVLIGRKGTIDHPRYMDQPFWTVDTLFYSIIENHNSAKFIYYHFCIIDWMQYNEASGVPSLNAKTIEGIKVNCPDFLEQQAIAAVLSDMDAELEKLEERREKTREMKQGMMQALLTGRVRLVGGEGEGDGV